jgi:GLPGLI family protein
MKQHLLIVLMVLTICGFKYSAYAQNLTAIYSVKKDIYIKDVNQIDNKIASIEYTGFLFKKNNNYISFDKPLYLNKFPNGNYVYKMEENHNYSILLSIDTIQNLNFFSIDSLIRRFRESYTRKINGRISNYFQEVDLNYHQWELLPENKTINGLNCQKAKLSIGGTPQWEVWFCPDIPVDVNMSGIFGLPGLIVEAYHVVLKKTYILESYEMNAVISDSIFWPKEFNEPFEIRPPLRRKETSIIQSKNK